MLIKTTSFCSLILFFILFAGSLSCSRINGSFGYKIGVMDSYRVFNNSAEFPQGAQISWVYSVDSVSSPNQIGVIILQKKAVWIDIESRTVTLDPETSRIFGEISTNEPGDYRIAIVMNKKIIDEVSYKIYNDEVLNSF
jgi:hypothetical protein